jgi:putative membrane protein
MAGPHDPAPPGGGRFDEAGDATRRTHLANERTYLAWWRTGLASLATGIGAGRLVPALTSGPQWPYTILGAGFALLGIAFIAYAAVRHRQVRDAIMRGEFERPDERFIAALAVLGVLLGLAILVIVIAES